MAGLPRRIVVFDTEANRDIVRRSPKVEEQTLRLGVAKIRDPDYHPGEPPHVLRFTEREAFHAALSRMPRGNDPIYVIAHNLGYDARIVGFLEGLSRGLYSLRVPDIHPRKGHHREPLFIPENYCTIIKLWRPDAQQIMLLSSTNWFRCKLEELGKALGYEKGDMPRDDAPEEEWWRYCERDVEVLDLALQRLLGWLGGLKCKTFSYTVAGQSMFLYRTRFEHKRIVRPPDPAVCALDRAGYYGGLVEVFHHGRSEGPIYHLDVNSLYPKVMACEKYPVELLKQGDMEGEADGIRSIPLDRSTAEVWLESGDEPYPVKGRDHTVWARGRVRTILCGPELRRAAERGHIRRVGRFSTFRVAGVFAEYVDYFANRLVRARARGDEFTAMICKGLLNSLHGKFGQKSGEWAWKDRCIEPHYYSKGVVFSEKHNRNIEGRTIDGEYQERCLDLEDRRGFVPIAAWTASYGRVYMDELRAIAGEDHVLYQSTDALFVDGLGLGHLQMAGLVDGSEIGLLKLKDTYEWVKLHTIHCYDTDKGPIRAGIKKASKHVGNDYWEIEDWESFSAAIWSGNHTSVSITTQSRHCSLRYTHRAIGPKGRTIPWTVDNWHIPPEEQAGLDALYARKDGIE